VPLSQQEDAKNVVTRTAFFKHHQFFNVNFDARPGLKAT